MRPAELYACIYVREFPAQALLRLRPDLKDAPCVVMQGEPPFHEVFSLNTKATLLGIRSGMRRTDLDGFPQAKIFSRSLVTESMVREMLLECAAVYSPRIEESSGEIYFLCVIDVTGTEHLFGPPETLAPRLLQHVRSLGLSARVIISSNFHTAVCLAKGSSGTSMHFVPSKHEAAALSGLPLDVLPLTEQQAEIFASWGIKTLAMLAELPDNELVARLGQGANRLQQLARGEMPHLFQPVEPPFRLEERQELDFPVESLDSLMFGIAMMLDQLLLRATARLVSLTTVTVELELDGGATHTCRVRPAQPGNDKKFWIRLLHLDLLAHPPQAAVVAINLRADPGDTSKIQLGLFCPPLPEPARLDVALAHLKTILGEENVGCATLRDSNAPDSFRIEPFNIPSGPTILTPSIPQRTSLRRLRPSEIVSVQLNNSRPDHFLFRDQNFAVERAYGPWLTGGEWWNEQIWNNEHWDVIARTTRDSTLYCCMTRNLLRNQWEVTALYD